MTNRQHILRSIALISLFMLMGQLTVLTHSVEHPFHTDDPSCQLSLHCEKSSNGLTPLNLQAPTLPSAYLLVGSICTLQLFFLKTAYSARAPPSLL